MSLNFSTHPENICILRLSAIGDVTHVLPMLRTLQKYWPQTRISWIIGKTEATLVGDIQGVEFIVFDKSRGARAHRDLREQLRGRRFDLLLNLQASLRGSLACLAVKAPIKLGYDKARARGLQWLFTNNRIAAIERQHVLDSFLEFPRALGMTQPVISWDIPLPEEAMANMKALIPMDKPVLAINACSSNRARNWRNWSVESYGAIIDYAAQTYGMQCVLTGGPNAMEREYAAQICAAASAAPIDLVGKTSLKELMALLHLSSALIAPDTGPAHMANAAGTPVIGLYASSNPLRTGPYLCQNSTVNRYPEALMKECGKRVKDVRWGQRVRDPEVMSLISVKDVREKLDLVMGTA